MPEGARSFRQLAHNTCVEVLLYMSPTHAQYIVDSVATNLNSTYLRFIRRNPHYTGKISVLAYSLGSVICYDLLAHQALPEECPVSHALRRLMRKHEAAKRHAAAAGHAAEQEAGTVEPPASGDADNNQGDGMNNSDAGAQGGDGSAAAHAAGGDGPRSSSGGRGGTVSKAARSWLQRTFQGRRHSDRGEQSVGPAEESPVSQQGHADPAESHDVRHGSHGDAEAEQQPAAGGGQQDVKQPAKATWSFRIPLRWGRKAEPTAEAQADSEAPAEQGAAAAAPGKDSTAAASGSLDDAETSASTARPEVHSSAVDSSTEGQAAQAAAPVSHSDEASTAAHATEGASSSAPQLPAQQQAHVQMRQASVATSAATSVPPLHLSRLPSIDAPRPAVDQSKSIADTAHPSTDLRPQDMQSEADMKEAMLRKRVQELQQRLAAANAELRAVGSASAQRSAAHSGDLDAQANGDAQAIAANVTRSPQHASAGVSTPVADHQRDTSALSDQLSRVNDQKGRLQQHAGTIGAGSDAVRGGERGQEGASSCEDEAELEQQTVELTRQLWPQQALASLHESEDVTMPSRNISYPVRLPCVLIAA